MINRLIGHVVELALLIWLLFVLAHGWAWLLIAAAISVPVGRFLTARNAARHMAERQRVARLIRRADEERRLIQRGSLDGVYGSYSPPPSMRGVGIWLSGDPDPAVQEGYP